MDTILCFLKCQCCKKGKRSLCCCKLNSNSNEISKVPEESEKILKLQSDLSLMNSSNKIIPIKEESPDSTYQKLNLMFKKKNTTIWKVKHKKIGLFRNMIIKNYTSKNKDKIDKEIITIKNIDHPNIYKIFEVYKTNDTINIITELIDGRNIFEEVKDLGPFPEKTAANIIYQILLLLNYLHNAKEIIHSKINIRSFYINSLGEDDEEFYDVKLVKLNSCIYESEKEIFSKQIFNNYYKYFNKCSKTQKILIAPEILKILKNNNCQNYNNKKYSISDKVDMWSLGILSYFMLSGQFPENREKIKFNLPVFDFISANAKDFITQLLKDNQHKRLSAKNSLKHKWFNSLETKKQWQNILKTQYPKCLGNIHKYNKSNALFDCSLSYLIHNIPDIGDVKDINKIYIALNTKGDGRLDREELKKGFDVSIINNNFISNKKDYYKIIDKLIEIGDKEKEGYIPFEEFIKQSIDKSLFFEEEVLQFPFDLFRPIDNIIFKSEIEKIINDDKKVHEIFRDIKLINHEDNKDYITFQDYCKMMNKFLV